MLVMSAISITNKTEKTYFNTLHRHDKTKVICSIYTRVCS